MKYKIVNKNSISRWEEALPLGNGKMGCLIWGSPAQLRFSLDRVDIWDTSIPHGAEAKEFTYANLVRLAQEGNIKEIRRIFDAPYYHPTPTKLPVGRIILHFPNYDDTRSELSLCDAQAHLELCVDERGKRGQRKGRNRTTLRSIVHATRDVGIICVDLPQWEFEVELKAPEFGRDGKKVISEYNEKERSISQGSLSEIVYEKAEWMQKGCKNGGHISCFVQKTNTDFSYGVVMGIQGEGDRTQIYYRIITMGDGQNAFAKNIEEIQSLMDCGYDGLYAEHKEWWGAYWRESWISLPDKRVERNWYISNYFLASCSRKGSYPMPLQGVWTADEERLPPWKGDYHNDLNTQMSYYHYLKANHLQQGESFLDFLWERRREGQLFAQIFYGTNGLCLPAVMTIDGKPLGGWPMYALSPVNQIWLCQAFDRYYRSTGDEKFLITRAYPYFRETEVCIGALLRKEGVYYHLPISSSPEIHDDEAEAFLTPNSNYDLALLRYLYDTLLWYAAEIKRQACGYMENIEVSEGEISRWEEKRRHLEELSVDERGVLMLSPDEVLKESHRHFSHAHAIHPLRLVKYDTEENQKLIDATIADLKQLGSSMWVGFSFCWMAELYAIAHRGEEAAEQLHIFWEYFCSSNGFHLNGDYKKKGYSTFDYCPFTLEANMCAADALQEMLLYTEDGVIEPFPAIPKSWEEAGVAFERLRGERGILISAKVCNGKLTSLILESEKVVPVVIKGWNISGERQKGAKYPMLLQNGENKFL